MIECGVLKKYIGSGGDVVIPEGVAKLGEHAFSGCMGLTAVVIPEGVTEVGWDVFEGCINLISVVIPKSLRKISVACFRNCTGIKYIENNSDCQLLTPWNEYEYYLPNKIESGFLPNEDFSKMKSIYKACAVACYISSKERYSENEQKVYNDYIKRRAWSLLTTYISAGLTLAIRNLLNTGFVKPATLERAIAETEDKPEIMAVLLDYWNRTVDNKKLQEQKEAKMLRNLMRTAPTVEELKKIWSVKKTETGLLEVTSYKGTDESVVVPKKIGTRHVTAIRKNAFSPMMEGFAYESCKNAEWRRTGLKKVQIPVGVTEIGASVFRCCKGLETVTLPEGLITIGDAAFELCDNLKELHIPRGVKELKESTASDCTSLTFVTLPQGLTKIDHFAFYGCTNLNSIVIPDSVIEIKSGAFYGCRNLTIHAPAGSFAECYAKENNIIFEAI